MNIMSNNDDVDTNNNKTHLQITTQWYSPSENALNTTLGQVENFSQLDGLTGEKWNEHNSDITSPIYYLLHNIDGDGLNNNDNYDNKDTVNEGIIVPYLEYKDCIQNLLDKVFRTKTQKTWQVLLIQKLVVYS